ncbi:MAG: hypothetical protein M3O02_03640 [Acidobacteriota bacterium]|nr:hypothetical protein [Acidobacteriota bacterium]
MASRPQIYENDLPREIAWTETYWVVILVALCIGLLVVLFSLTIDRMLNGEFRHIYASDWLEALAAAMLSGAALVRMQSRRRELLMRMQIVEDVNHHVRNALTSIVFSASLRGDAELNAQVSDACARIDWVLSDVLSQSVKAQAHWRERSRWGSGRKLKG